MNWQLITMAVFLCATATLGQTNNRTGATLDDKVKLYEIRIELRNLANNVENLRAEIKTTRYGILANAIRLLRSLRQSNAPRSQIIGARRIVESTRSELREFITMKREEQLVMWCLRSCIRTFFRNFDRTALDTCSAGC